MIKKIFTGIIVTLVVLSAVVYFYFIRHKPVTEHNVTTTVQNAKVTTVHKKDVNDFYEAAGTIQAGTISVISSRIMGTVTAMLVRQGDTVSTGQTLIVIDSNDLAQQVKVAQAMVDQSQKAYEASESNKNLAETTYNRYRQLYDNKALTGQEMDQVTNQRQQAQLDFERSKAAVEAAQANLKQANINLEFSRLRSPINGVVTHKNIDKGSMATPGAPLMTVEETNVYKVQTTIDESMLGQMKISIPVDVVIDSIAKTFKGTISEIVPSVDPSSRTFVIKAGIIRDTNAHLLANGQYARVIIPQKKRSILAVPLTAIVRRGQLTGVYVVGQDNSIIYRLIRTGRTFGSEAEVLSGLNDGDKIIAEDVNNIVEGNVVRQNND
jgi:RND family efflux transporter MFP subunit